MTVLKIYVHVFATKIQKNRPSGEMKSAVNQPSVQAIISIQIDQ